jgi:hypothetical protein
MSFLTSLAAVSSVATALHLILALLITLTAAPARVWALAVFGHANESMRTLAIIKSKCEAHDETSDTIIRLILVNSIITASDIEPAMTNEVPKLWQIIRQRSIPLILSLMPERPKVDPANTHHQYAAIHPALSDDVPLIVDARKVERRLESARNVCRLDAMLRESFEDDSFLNVGSVQQFSFSEHIAIMKGFER